MPHVVNMKIAKGTRDEDLSSIVYALIWSITLSASYLVGWLTAFLVSMLMNVPHAVEITWKWNGSYLGLIVGAGLGGVLTVSSAKHWVNEIGVKSLLVAGFGWSLSMAIIFLLINITGFDL